MSVEHMALVFAAQGLDGSEKLLLLAYTNYTDPHGYCWPGEERLAEDTGTSVSTVRRTKKKLIDKALVKSVRRPETSNLARVNLPLLASLGRPRKAYGDNEMERLSFEGPPVQASDSGPDLGTVQSDLSLLQGSDLRTVQIDRDHRSDCTDGQVNLTGATGQSDLQSISDPSGEAISRPSFPAGASDAEQGGTDGSERSNRSPGVDLLLAIGAKDPKFLLTGKTLTDQGLTVTGMLLEGWTEDQLRYVITGRPLPEQVKTTVGAIVACRLREAITGPSPASARKLPAQTASGSHEETEGTWTPPSWTGSQGLDAAVATLHRAKCSECHRPLRGAAKDALCADCREDETV